MSSLAHGQDQDAARMQYSATIRSTYNYAFGKDKPFAPSNAAVEGNEFLQTGAFPNAQYCAHCHQEAYHQWRQALHSNAFRTPFYRTSVNLLIYTKGIEYARHCDSCHNPIGVLTGALTENSQVDRKFDEDGVTCMVCHSIQGLKSTSGNGGYIMGVPAVMTDENGNRIPGEVPYYKIMKYPARHAKAVMQPFYRTPEFCAACHKANLPETLNGYKFLPAFSAYDEWQSSKFSQRNPLTFYTADFKTCQGCHMERSPNRFQDYGAKNGTFASHRWLAGNTAVPFYYGFNEQLQMTEDFLRSGDYLNVDIFAIKKENEKHLIAPLGSIPFHLDANSIIQVYVIIQNKNIGHSFIPEVRDLYEAWVEFSVKDADGQEIFHSGFLKPDGMLDESAHSFTNRPVNTNGHFVDNHQVWTIHSVAYDNTVPSGRSDLVRYEFRIPANAKGPLTITAKVNYRHLRQSYLNNVFGKDHPAYPVVEIASRSRIINIGENQPTSALPTDNPDWKRWNNLGIGYLDQLQYAAAVRAFRQVTRLRPHYADAYINISITEIEWEKFASARAAIDRALRLRPNYARALYYRALLERRSGQSDAELADLKNVVSQYPQSRDARRELGITYYQRAEDEQAIQQFEALQNIDPDDLASHYNLSILYRRMGMKKQALEQQALFLTEKTDPSAPTYSLDYLQKHPEISIESIPWHVHTDIPHGENTSVIPQ
jgi:Tfp pilus assembly protein PilF